jgi:flagellar hook-associated protein 1 FlgK
MSLFSSIQLANNSLFAAQTGLQVTGNNIANAGTPGYIRQEVVLTPASTALIGALPIGLGVQVTAIIQQADRFLNERLRNAASDLAQSEAQEDAYLELEGIIGELSEIDLSSSLSRFFGSIHNVLNQPEDMSLRNLVAVQGGVLTQDIRRLAEQVNESQTNFNERVVDTASSINSLLEQIAEVNVQIVVTEGGGKSPSDAVGLRDQREILLGKLSEIVSVRSVEQQDGSVIVFAGGDYLVAAGEYRPVTVYYDPAHGQQRAYLHIQDSDSPLAVSSGKLAGYLAARDDILAGYLAQLDDLSRTLNYEFNKLYSSGQGLYGYTDLTSEFAVTDTTAALDQAGLVYTPVNGTFRVLVRNTNGLTTTTEILVDLNGLDDDLSLSDLATMLDDIDGIQAEIGTDNRLHLAGDSSEIEFGFAQDTSGLLAALGLNTFFTGTSSSNIGVSEIVGEDPGMFATSQNGFGQDADNAVVLADFANRPLDAANSQTFTDVYEQFVSEVAEAAAVNHSLTEGFRVFRNTLESQQLGISGVSIDDEVVKMITYQRVYQASARFIAAIGELFDVLVNL